MDKLEFGKNVEVVDIYKGERIYLKSTIQDMVKTLHIIHQQITKG